MCMWALAEGVIQALCMHVEVATCFHAAFHLHNVAELKLLQGQWEQVVQPCDARGR